MCIEDILLILHNYHPSSAPHKGKIQTILTNGGFNHEICKAAFITFTFSMLKFFSSEGTQL
jgi:hypothetical protein